LVSDTPFGQVPLLEYDGQLLSQSISIARFLAKKTGLHGKDDLEQARADMIVDYVTDFNNSKGAHNRARSYD
jgi:glutathione S-transferase